MRESFLHFIWQFQKFNNINLSTNDGRNLQIFSIGQYNTDSGPDFLNSKLLIDDITWYGHVEIHLRSSDWNRHKHQKDDSYNNVVLHVVWEHDLEVKSADDQLIPVLELKKRIKPDLLKKCNKLIKNPEKIPCADQFTEVKDIDKWSMLDQVGVMRLVDKSQLVLQYLKENSGSWEETTYQLLAKNFGFRTNEIPFLKLSNILSHKILAKHVNRLEQVEALIFGLAGFLSKPKDEYTNLLKKEFDYLSKKYKLAHQEMILTEWKFLRMRPSNFPSVRLAQFASFNARNSKCFERFINYKNIPELLDIFKFSPSAYWTDHYDFGKSSARKMTRMGKGSADLILINTVAPILAAYAQYTDDSNYMDKAVELLQSLKPEKNNIIRKWEELSLKPKDAYDSQSMINLHNEFCLKKKCLSCKIGVSLISK